MQMHRSVKMAPPVYQVRAQQGENPKSWQIAWAVMVALTIIISVIALTAR